MTWTLRRRFPASSRACSDIPVLAASLMIATSFAPLMKSSFSLRFTPSTSPSPAMDPAAARPARGPRLAAELERQLAAVFASVSVTVVALALLLRRAHDPAASSGHLRDRVFPAQRVDELVEEVRREIEPRRAFEERVASGDALGVFSERRRRGRGRKQIPGMRLRRRRRRRHHSVREHRGPPAAASSFRSAAFRRTSLLTSTRRTRPTGSSPPSRRNSSTSGFASPARRRPRRASGSESV